MRLFALDESKELGARIAFALGQDLSELEHRDFQDGECKTRPICLVKGAPPPTFTFKQCFHFNDAVRGMGHGLWALRMSNPQRCLGVEQLGFFHVGLEME